MIDDLEAYEAYKNWTVAVTVAVLAHAPTNVALIRAAVGVLIGPRFTAS